jgi:adenylate kinase family enzyme
MNSLPLIVFIGGPGGGKSTLIEELARVPAWRPLLIHQPDDREHFKAVKSFPAQI